MCSIKSKINKLCITVEKHFPQYKKEIYIGKTNLILLDEVTIKDNIIDIITRYDISTNLSIEEIELCINEYFPKYKQDIKKLDIDKKKEILLVLQDIIDSIISET